MDHCASQFQYNFLDVEYQAGTCGLQYAASKGLAVVIMEPGRGAGAQHPAGRPGAVGFVPPSLTFPYFYGEGVRPSPAGREDGGEGRTPADWALQWLWNQPEVSLVLSGMSTMEQVEQNLASASRSGVGTMTEEELALVGRARRGWRSRSCSRSTTST